MQVEGQNRNDLIRLFAAVSLNDEVLGNLAAEQERLKPVAQEGTVYKDVRQASLAAQG